MSAPSAARARWGVLAAATALVVGVVLLRPDVAAVDADLRVDDRSPLNPERLRSTPVSELVVASDGIGPVTLRTTVEELVAAGWPAPVLGSPGARCARLPRVEVDGATLTGWASGDVVVAVQLETEDRVGDARRSAVGFSLGDPVTAVEAAEAGTGPDREPAVPTTTTQVLAGETGTVQVALARWRFSASDVVASDLGRDGVRYVQVSSPGGEACRLTPDVLAAEQDAPYPTEAAAAAAAWQDAGARLTSMRAGADPALVGLGRDRQADAGDSGGDGACRGLAAAARLLRGDGVATGERPEGAELAVAPPPGRLYGLASGTRARTTSAQVDDAGAARVVTRVTVEVSAVLVEDLDTFAVVGAGVRQVTADGCA